MNNNNFNSEFVMVIIFLIFLIFIGRELVCWYYKLNRIVELLERIDSKLGRGDDVVNTDIVTQLPQNEINELEQDNDSNLYKVYANGNKYIGEIENGQRNGRGTMIYSDGSELTGQWKNGFFVG